MLAEKGLVMGDYGILIAVEAGVVETSIGAAYTQC